jgi:hypothetical protein
MRRWYLAFLLVMSSLVACTGVAQNVEDAQESQAPPPAEVNGVSIIQLVATPDKYHGHYVRVIGYVQLEFEGNAIYLSKDDERYGVYKNGLWLDMSGEFEEDTKLYDGKFCLVEGTFDVANHGHMGLWSGAIENIKRLQAWERVE